MNAGVAMASAAFPDIMEKRRLDIVRGRTDLLAVEIRIEIEGRLQVLSDSNCYIMPQGIRPDHPQPIGRAVPGCVKKPADRDLPVENIRLVEPAALDRRRVFQMVQYVRQGDLVAGELEATVRLGNVNAHRRVGVALHQFFHQRLVEVGPPDVEAAMRREIENLVDIRPHAHCEGGGKRAPIANGANFNAMADSFEIDQPSLKPEHRVDRIGRADEPRRAVRKPPRQTNLIRNN